MNNWEFVEYVGSGVVFLGVLGEYLAEFHLFKSTEGKRRRLARWSTLFLLGGLAIELLGLVRTSQLNARIVATLNREAEEARKTGEIFHLQIAEARARAASAEESAQKASERVAIAARQAAEANQAAEHERMARLKLENLVAWRTITDRQRKKFLDLAAPLNGKGIILRWGSMDPEVDNFANLIISMFADAGMKVTPQTAVVTVGGIHVGPGQGPPLSIEVGQHRIEDAKCLARAFIDSGIISSPIPAGPLNRADFLLVQVGTKNSK